MEKDKELVQELFDALSKYQKNNRLKHDGDAELFDAAEPVLEKARKAGLIVRPIGTSEWTN